MASSDLWRELAIQFRNLPEAGILRADWQYSVGSGVPGEWRLTGGASISAERQFEALARRAGAEIADENASDLLVSPGSKR